MSEYIKDLKSNLKMINTDIAEVRKKELQGAKKIRINTQKVIECLGILQQTTEVLLKLSR